MANKEISEPIKERDEITIATIWDCLFLFKTEYMQAKATAQTQTAPIIEIATVRGIKSSCTSSSIKRHRVF